VPNPHRIRAAPTSNARSTLRFVRELIESPEHAGKECLQASVVVVAKLVVVVGNLIERV